MNLLSARRYSRLRALRGARAGCKRCSAAPAPSCRGVRPEGSRQILKVTSERSNHYSRKQQRGRARAAVEGAPNLSLERPAETWPEQGPTLVDGERAPGHREWQVQRPWGRPGQACSAGELGGGPRAQSQV